MKRFVKYILGKTSECKLLFGNAWLFRKGLITYKRSQEISSGRIAIANFINLNAYEDCMKVIIHSHHLEVTSGLKTHLEDKLNLIKKHFDQIIQINAILGIDKAHEKELRQTAELSLHVLGKDLFALAHHEDLYQAIDLAVSKLDKQIIKVKEKVKNHHRPIAFKHISADSSVMNL